MSNSDYNRKSVIEQVEFFYDLGFDPIPLKAESKRPVCQGWQHTHPQRQWRGAPADANVGLRAGGPRQLSFLDCDEKETPEVFQNVLDHLSGLGLSDFPIIQTISGGHHIYLTQSYPIEGSKHLFKRDVGAGQLNHGSGSYVVAPPSTINSVTYSLVSGNYSHLPVVDPKDLAGLLGEVVRVDHDVNMPQRVKEIVFPSRSEDEQSIIVSLINQGATLEQVQTAFTQFWPPKFRELYQENPRNAIRWLSLSYAEAYEWATTHESKEKLIIRELQAWANDKPWPGRAGSYNRAVYLAHLSIAFKAGRLRYDASVRSVAEQAGVCVKTAWKATNRIKAMDLVSLFMPGNVVDAANTYEIKQQNVQEETHPHKDYLGCVSSCTHSDAIPNAFRGRGGLGKPAYETYTALQASGTLTVKQLADKTGRHRTTIMRALAKLANVQDSVTGEIKEMVLPVGKGEWCALAVDLDHIAAMLGNEHAIDNQKRKHEQERHAHMRPYLRFASEASKSERSDDKGDSH